MANKRILLVGNANHQFITNYVKWLKKKAPYFQIDIITNRPVKGDYKELYDNVYHIDFNDSIYQFVSRIKGVRRFYRFHLYKKILKTLPEYNYIHIHFLTVDASFLALLLKRKTNPEIIISIWGSDFYRIGTKDKKRFTKACHIAGKVTFSNERTRDDFIDRLNWQKDNLHVCRFGLAPLEVLKKMQKSKEESKVELGWETEKLAITIGYNSNPAQQHLEIIEQLNKADGLNYTDSVKLIIPLTYGSGEAYKKRIKEALQKSKFDFKLYKTYLDDVTIAKIRKASDIMIQVQTTDQFSGSMQEHLFTQNVVITGSWLPYETMKEYGAYFLEVDEVKGISQLVPKVINEYKDFYKNTTPNPEVISELSSWEKNINDWIVLYN